MLTRTGKNKKYAEVMHANVNCTRAVLVLMLTAAIRMHVNACVL